MGRQLAMLLLLLVLLLLLTEVTGQGKNNNKKKGKTTTQPPVTTPPATDRPSSDSGLSPNGKIVVGALCTLIALLVLGLVAILLYFKTSGKVASSFGGGGGGKGGGGGNTYYSPRPLGKPGHVTFDSNAPVYSLPTHTYIPPGNLSGGYSGYRPEYPPPYGLTVPQQPAFSRLITR